MSNFELAKQYFLEGAAFLEAENFSQAEYKFRKSLELIPDRASTLTNLSIAQLKLKKYSEAKASVEKAISVERGNAEAYLNLGLIEKESKGVESAVKFFDKALSLKPDYAEAWSNKGAALHELKNYKEAIICHDKALTLKPDYAEGWSNKGNTLNELKQYDEAIAHYDKALTLKPHYAQGWLNKGNALRALKCYEKAIAHYDQALTVKRDYHEAWTNKGNTLYELKRYEEAIFHYDKALGLSPDIDWVPGALLHTKMKICNWSNLVDSLGNISQRVMRNEKVASPFLLLALDDDGFLHKKSSELYAQDGYPMNLALDLIAKRPKQEKIRIGYFSTDFRNHAVSSLTAELFELHDKNRFEIIAFSFGADDNSPMRLRLRQAFHQFIDVDSMSDLEIAKLSRDLKVDIAVDLGGYTTDNRVGIFAYRAAPIQLSYIGYLGTMGSGYYDYLLADKVLIPEGLQKFYSEKIAYLFNYQVNDRKRVISERHFTKIELGLPEESFVFCCFNNNYKILPSTFDGWMRILKAVENSVLFLYADNELSKTNLINEAELRGIDRARLVFGARIPADEYLARYRTCNLFLDTFPYNAGTTASDALWAGLPVITLIGSSFPSRVAASLLNAVGLPELITSTQAEYETLAIELAMNPNKLVDIKLKLANNRLTAPLFDTPLFAKNIEALYIKMYERYQADLPPEHISIE